MQCGSEGTPQGTAEGDCNDIAHYHSRLEGTSPAPGYSGITLASAQPAVATSGDYGTRGGLQLQQGDVRSAIIWSEILKRPRWGVAPRMR